jgi:hypothetical protein
MIFTILLAAASIFLVSSAAFFVVDRVVTGVMGAAERRVGPLRIGLDSISEIQP